MASRACQQPGRPPRDRGTLCVLRHVRMLVLHHQTSGGMIRVQGKNRLFSLMRARYQDVPTITRTVQRRLSIVEFNPVTAIPFRSIQRIICPFEY